MVIVAVLRLGCLDAHQKTGRGGFAASGAQAYIAPKVNKDCSNPASLPQGVTDRGERAQEGGGKKRRNKDLQDTNLTNPSSSSSLCSYILSLFGDETREIT
uniref:Uncharacterized protein n=1 Tax=Oryza meridionalis TaxID=40149 RepID=A0A0E0E454_9ORYZ